MTLHHNIHQRPHTNDQPQQDPLHQGLHAYRLQYIGRERGSDEEHRDDESLTCQAGNGLAYLGYTIEDLGVYQNGHNEPKNEPWDADFPTFALEDE